MDEETNTATAETLSAESPPKETKKAAASEEEQIEEYVKEHGEKELADDEKSSAAGAAAGGEKPEGTAPTALSKEDEEWLELKRLGVPRDQLVAYAQHGWEAQQAKGAKGEKKAGQETPGEQSDEELEPITRAEFNDWKKGMESKTRLTVAAAQNQLKLEGFLAGHELTREDPETSEIVERKTYELMAAGKPLGEAFKEATDKHAGYLRRHERRFVKKKIAQNKARGESAPGEAAATPTPAFEHKASDFQDGTALEHAIQLARSDDRMATGRPL